MNNFTSPISEVYWPNVSSENYFHYLQHLCTENRKTSWIYSLRQTPLITADCRTSMSLNCMGPLILRFFFFFLDSKYSSTTQSMLAAISRYRTADTGRITYLRANCKFCADFPLQRGSVPLHYPTVFKDQLHSQWQIVISKDYFCLY